MNPSSQPQASPERILSTLLAYRDAAALNTAIELELFTRIAHGADTVHRLASDLDAPVRGIRLLCDYLADAGLITRDGDEMRLAPDAATFLDRRSPSYLAGAAGRIYSVPMVRAFERLTDCVRGTESGEPIALRPDWLDAARGVADQAAAARAMADLVTFHGGPLKVLDVCAGEGAYGISIAARYPEAVVVAADRPEALKAAHENAARSKIGTRYQDVAGDLLTMPLGRNFDAAICAGGLYRLDPTQIEVLMKRIREALKKTGQLLIVEYLSEDNSTNPSFGLTMLALTRRGGAYSMAEVKDMLRLSGFGTVESQPLAAAHATLITARL